LQLTDFVSARVPKLSVCTAGDMLSLTPADVWSKLRLLFYVVLGLFWFMNVGTVIGYVMDSAQQRSVLSRLQLQNTGFRKLQGNIWTWTCVQNRLRHDVETPSGSAWELCAIFGLPFVRLRACLPEECFPGSIGHAVGRRTHLSIQGLAQARDRNLEALKQMVRELRGCFTGSRRRIPSPADEEGGADDFHTTVNSHERRAHAASATELRHSRETPARLRKADASHHDIVTPVRNTLLCPDSDGTDASARFVGTALVLAFLANANVMPSLELARLRAAAVSHYAGVLLVGIDHTFERMVSLFTVLLSPGNISSHNDWMAKARLWRLVLLQRADGGWDLTNSLSFAVEAHAGTLPPKAPPTSQLRQKLSMLIRWLLSFIVDQDIELENESVTEELASMRSPQTVLHAADADRTRTVSDCPLTFSAAAIAASMPAALASLNTARSRHRKPQLMQPDRAPPARATPRAGVADEARALPRSRNDQRGATPNASGSYVGDLQPSSMQLATHIMALPGATSPLQREQVATWLLPQQAAPPGAQQWWAALNDVVPELTGGMQPFTVTDPTLVPTASDSVSSLDLAFTFVPKLFGGLQQLPVENEPSWTAPETTPANGRAPAATIPHSEAQIQRPNVRRARSGSSGRVARAAVDVQRIWATIVALSVLEGMDISWLVDEENTMVDQARKFLEAQGRADDRVARLLRHKTLEVEAERVIKRWQAVLSHHISLIRGEKVINAYTALKHFQRASTRILLSVMTEVRLSCCPRRLHHTRAAHTLMPDPDPCSLACVHVMCCSTKRWRHS
jgi:hypothetical protein